MRSSLVVTAIVSTSIACGGLLGFGEDDDLPPASTDGGADAVVTDASGSSDGSTATVCERHVLDLSARSNLDAAIAAEGWQSYETGNVTMAIVDGKLHIASDPPAMIGTSNEANVGRRVDGDAGATRLSRVTCKFDYRASSWGNATGGQGRIAQLRLFGSSSDWSDFYDVHVDWDNGFVRSAIQADRANDAGIVEQFESRENRLPENELLPVEIDFVSSLDGGAGTVHVGLGPTLSIDQPAPGPTKFHAVRAIVGVFTPPGNTSPAYSVDIGNIDCNFCFAP